MKKSYALIFVTLAMAGVVALAALVTQRAAPTAFVPVETEAEYAPAEPTVLDALTDTAEPFPDFPSLFLTTPNHPFDQVRHHRQDGALTLVSDTPAWDFDAIAVSVRGRGNTTWFFGEDKRPLRIRFDTPRTVLDSAYAHREWILLANHFDRSLLRNHGVFYLSSLLDGLLWTPFSRFVHLYINGEYYGVYELTEERDIAPGRVDIAFDPDSAVSEYFLELNGHVVGWRSHEFEAGIHYFMVQDRAYELRWPTLNMRDDAHFDYAQDYIQRVSDAIRTHDWDAIVQLIDLPSFIDFYLVQELFKNVDIGRFGVFMQIRGQGENRRLYLGPVWDFDQSSGNMERVQDPAGPMVERHNYWYHYLMRIPAFRQMTAARWDVVRETYVPQTIAHIRFMGQHYAQAFQRNFDRHPSIWGDRFEWNWTHAYATAAIDNFPDQVEFLANFLTLRAQWMDDFVHRPLPQQGYETDDDGGTDTIDGFHRGADFAPLSAIYQ